jgi:hypothetical protein
MITMKKKKKKTKKTPEIHGVHTRTGHTPNRKRALLDEP